MGKLLVKYDVRGIQAFVFRTNKFKEIRAVSDLPERIIMEAADEVLKDLKIEKPIEWLDTKGGNALAVFDTLEEFYQISTRMAVKVLEKSYSLKLVYSFIELDPSKKFHEQYRELNKKLGKLKSSMPEVTHTGVFPICRQDYLTGFPISGLECDKEHKKVFLTEESILKLKQAEDRNKNSDIGKYDDVEEPKVLDDMILGKNVDSHIAVIHIDGNNMGYRINRLIEENAKYDEYGGFKEIKKTFKSITVAERFKDVCLDVKEIVKQYKEKLKEEKINAGTYMGENDEVNKPLIYSVIAAGDDITYVTRANIALPFTKLFLKKVSELDMYSDSDDHEKYGINACAGIAFIKSHFPFSDAYELAERCCASAKKRAKSEEYCIVDQNNPDNKMYGNWIDFEICTHIKNVDLEESRQKYTFTTDGEGNTACLHMRPYCVASGNKFNDFFDYDEFEKRIEFKVKSNNTDDSEKCLNRSRVKMLRQVYTDGGSSVELFKESAESRKYELEKELFSIDTVSGRTFAQYYDASDVVDLIDAGFVKYVNSILNNGGENNG